jgi:predicted nuclease of predicted toxin-antitoxin system
VRFLVDMPLSPELCVWLQSLGHDAVHANDLGMSQAPDVEILRRAAEAGRVIVTADLDFPRLLSMVNASGPGLILLRGGNYSEAESRACVQRVLMQISHDDLPCSIVVVEPHKVRRRGLPIQS